MTQGGLGVMCCGCYRMMGHDGKPFIGMRQGKCGPEAVVNPGPDDIAFFSSAQECDEAAKKAGWTTEDRKGSNHCCPDCQKPKPKPTAGLYPERRGAYVTKDTFAAHPEAPNLSSQQPPTQKDSL